MSTRTGHGRRSIRRPVITVTRGEPTPAELAAVLAVLLAARSATAAAPAAEPGAAFPLGGALARPDRPPSSRPALLACLRPAALTDSA